MTETTETINQQIVHVPFNGQTVDAVAGDNQNTYFVALKPICKNIGVEYSAQYRRLNRQPWATIAMMAIVGDDGKTRDMVCVDRQTLVMWLATIDSTRLESDDARRVVAEYQKECAKALDDYFFQGFAVKEDDYDTVCRALLIVKDKLDRSNAAVKSLETQVDVQDRFIDELRPKALVADAVFAPSKALYTVTEATRYMADIVPGVKREDLFDLLRSTGMMCRRGTAPTRAGIDTGRMVAVADEFTDKNGEVRAGEQRGKLTPKGVAFCIERLAAGEVA